MKIQIVVIYAIRNLINGKIYVGSTNDFSTRKMKHLTDLRANRHHSPILQSAFKKYGESSFQFEIIEVLSDPNDLLWKEQHYLDTLKPQYNICKKVEQSRLGLKNSPEHCARMSASLKGRLSPMKGKKFSTDHKRKISVANKGNKNCLGHQHSQETKKLLKAHHNKKSNPLRSDETKKKLSEVNLKRWASYTPEERATIGQKISQSQIIIKKTFCIVCNKNFEYHSQGKNIPKTCSPECFSKYRKNLLNERRQKDPGMDQRASQKRWGTELRKKVAPKYQRVPPKKGPCLICNKEIKYYAYGGKRTCSKECSLKYLHNQLEIKSNNKTKQVCEFIKKHARNPSPRSKDQEEVNLGRFLGSKRQAKVGKGTVIFFITDQEIATNYGYPNLFEINNPESNSNLMCKKMCEWIKLNGRKPSIRSVDKEENKLAEWLHYKRKACKGQIGMFYSSDQSIVDSYGYVNIFN